MIASVAEILDAALKLPEPERLLVASRLMDTLPADLAGLSVDDPKFLDELERRAVDPEPGVPVSELWKRE
jgi:hypothetical protein